MRGQRCSMSDMLMLREQGKTNSEIAKILGCGRTTVYRKIGSKKTYDKASHRTGRERSLIDWLNAFPDNGVFYMTGDSLMDCKANKDIFTKRSSAETYARKKGLLFFFKCYIVKGKHPKFAFTFERVRNQGGFIKEEVMDNATIQSQ